MENGSLFDKLVKQRPDISMMMDLWRIYTESTSTVVQNYCIVYVEMGFERLLSEVSYSVSFMSHFLSCFNFSAKANNIKLTLCNRIRQS